MKREIRIPGLAFALVLSFAAFSCGNAANNPDRHQDAGVAANASPVVDGWKSLEMIANSAKTTFDGTGHFNTSRNACGKDTFGSTDVGLWRRLIDDLNAAAKAPMVEKAVCTDLEAYSKFDGNADLVLEDGSKRSLFEIQNNPGWQYCTHVADPDLAKRLQQDLQDLVIAADKEECPNGWGSG